MVNFYNTLLVISMVNYCELLQHTLSNLMVNFYNPLLVISTVDCCEFNRGLWSDWLIAEDFIKPLGRDN